ncbi:uncharacterized protein TNCV_1385461 [Trichonephila clavipes]|nr:uncharacterized protein TNCV_1385461 [Trichonephila clavipes]
MEWIGSRRNAVLDLNGPYHLQPRRQRCYPHGLNGSCSHVTRPESRIGVVCKTSVCMNSSKTFPVARIAANLNPASETEASSMVKSTFGLAIHQNDHQARRRFVEWTQNAIAVVPDFHKRILFSDEAHFWLNGYVNKQNCRIWSEANPQVYVETPLHPEELTVWCAFWAGGILLQKR